MHTPVSDVLSVFMGFFAIMNPIANIPIFVSLTADDDADTRRAVARRALVVSFLIILVFVLGGKLIFEVFDITMAAFRITGGLLLGLIGFHMVQGVQSAVHQPGRAEKSKEAALSVAVSPLAMPILAGPGTITTAMTFAAGDVERMGIAIVCFAVLCVLTYFLFVFGEQLVRFIGAAALGAITRMMGLLLAVIGVQMLIGGIQAAFHLKP